MHSAMSEDITPWNPSRRATARVKDGLPAPSVCHYCGSDVHIVHHIEIYGRVFGNWPWAYQCDNCRAYVGMHPFTNIPLGTLADDQLRKARIEAKAPFNLLWSKKMTRTEAYEALAKHMGKDAGTCHFGMFTLDECHVARDWAINLRKEMSCNLSSHK